MTGVSLARTASTGRGGSRTQGGEVRLSLDIDNSPPIVKNPAVDAGKTVWEDVRAVRKATCKDCASRWVDFATSFTTLCEMFSHYFPLTENFPMTASGPKEALCVTQVRLARFPTKHDVGILQPSLIEAP
jgi:hypothetical protein